MDLTEYQALVERQRSKEARNPRAFAWKVNAFLALGRLFPVIMAVGMLAVIAGFVALVALGPHVLVLFAKFFLVLLIPIGVFLRAGFVSVPPPEGVPITRSEAPELWSRIDQVASSMEARVPDHVVLRGEFNASVSSIPRWLGFRYSTWLSLGEPLLRCLDTRHLDAVIAHELAHLQRGDGRLGARAYRAQRALDRLVEELRRRDAVRGTATVLRFYEWYQPRFAAMSHALRYRHEVHADRAAASATSPRVHAETLAAIDLRSQRFDDVELRAALVTVLADPTGNGVLAASPRGEIAELAMECMERPRTRSMRLALAHGLLVPQPAHDEHPTLATRMSLSGHRPPVSLDAGLVDPNGFLELAAHVEEPIAATAWDELVAPGRLESGAVDAWRDRAEPGRRARLQSWACAARDRLQELEGELEAGTIVASGFPEFVYLAVRAGRELDDVLATLRAQVDRHPDNVFARLELARALAVTRDPAGAEQALALFEEIGDATPTLRPLTLAAARSMHVVSGDAASFAHAHAAFETAVEEFETARDERARPFADTDEFGCADLDDARRARVTRALTQIPGLRAAWLTRRRHATFPDAGGDFVVVIERTGAPDGTQQRASDIAISDAMGDLYRDCTPLEDWSIIDGMPAGLETVVERMRANAEELTVSVDDERPRPIRSYAQLHDQLAARNDESNAA